MNYVIINYNGNSCIREHIKQFVFNIGFHLAYKKSQEFIVVLRYFYLKKIPITKNDWKKCVCFLWVSEGKTSKGKMSEGKTTEGKMSEGEITECKMSEGKMTECKMSEGKMTEG